MDTLLVILTAVVSFFIGRFSVRIPQIPPPTLRNPLKEVKEEGVTFHHPARAAQTKKMLEELGEEDLNEV